MDHVQKIRLLQSIPFFQDLGPDELKEIAGLLKDRTYPPNHEVITEGQVGNSCYIIVQGKVAICKGIESGEVILGMRHSGDFFGEMALLESTTRSATVRTLEDSHLLELPGEAFQRLVQQNVVISSVVAQELSRRLRDTDDKLIAALDELSHHIRQREEVLLPAISEREQELAKAEQRLASGLDKLKEASLDVLQALVMLLEAKHPHEQGHSRRVATYAIQIAREVSLPSDEVERLKIAGLLHDIGRLGISDAVLGKAGGLSTSEWTMVQRSPQYGVNVLRNLDFVQDALPIIQSHHERWDGQGYPKGLADEEIPLGARILAVAEAYDAMLCDRPYRPAKTPAEAMQTLRDDEGRRWDPAVVTTFLAILEQAPEGDRTLGE